MDIRRTYRTDNRCTKDISGLKIDIVRQKGYVRPVFQGHSFYLERKQLQKFEKQHEWLSLA